MTCRVCLTLQAIVVLLLYSAHGMAQSQCPIGGGGSGGGSPDGGWGDVTAIVYEDFEDAVLPGSYASGFDWGSGVRISIVRDDQFVVWNGDDILNGPISGRNWDCVSGQHSLRFRCPPGANGMSEQRFSMGGAYPDVWIGYWIKVPINWRHGSGNTNNKFFAIWMDEYEREGPTGVIQTRSSGGNSTISPYVRTIDNQHLGETGGALLIDASRDRGRWMQVVIHAKMATGASQANGVFEMFRRWEGDSQFETIFQYDDWDNYHVGGNRGFAHGYIMGWFNATQSDDTEWLLDDFIISEENLLGSDPASPRKSPGPITIPDIILPLN